MVCSALKMISVLMPVRNGARSLCYTLQSLRSQTLQPTECVIIDDGSTDETPEILSRWVRDWPVLRVRKLPGVGIARALNAGLELCRYPWIARMDADDVAHEERLERQIKETARDRNVCLVSCRVRHVSQDPGLQSLGMQRHVAWANDALTHEELARALWIDSPLPHPTWLVHRRALELVGGYSTQPDVPEDYEWLHRFFQAARQGAPLRAVKAGGEPLLDWVDSSGRLTRVHEAYLPQSFDRVKVAALKKWIGAESREIVVFGLGPKAKALIPLMKESFPIHAIVDVNPRHEGIIYQGIKVWSVDTWQSYNVSEKTLVLNCVGTPEAREKCEQACVEAGLVGGKTFISL